MEKSIVKKLYDFRNVPIPPKLLELKVSEKAVEQELSSTAERFLVIEAVPDGIRAGDIVRIQIPDETKVGAAKILQINVGLGFAGQELEDGVLGLRQGDTRRLSVENREIPAQVISVKRRNIPKLTDELICRLGLEGIKTVAEYREYTVRQIAQRVARGRNRALCDLVIKKVLEQSEFQPITQENPEYDLLLHTCEKQVRDMAAQTGQPEEKILAQTMGMQGKTAHECRQALRDECQRQVKIAALGRVYGQAHGVVFTTEDAARQYETYAPQLGETAENLEKQTMLKVHLIQMYIEYCKQTIEKYYQSKYRVVMAP